MEEYNSQMDTSEPPTSTERTGLDLVTLTTTTGTGTQSETGSGTQAFTELADDRHVADGRTGKGSGTVASKGSGKRAGANSILYHMLMILIIHLCLMK